MTRILRAWWILLYRSPALYIAPVLAGLSFYSIWSTRTRGVAYWPKLSTDIASGQTLVCIAFVGLAAWRGRRERSQPLSDLVASLNGSNMRHLVLVWSTLIGCGLLSYSLTASATMLWFGRDATWGGPDWIIIIPAGLSIVAAVSLGFAAGLIAPYIVTSPLSALLWWYLDGTVALRHGSERYLVPRALFENIASSIYYAPFPRSVPYWQIWLMLGLGLAGLGIALLRYCRGPALKVLIVVFVGLLVFFPASRLLAIAPDWTLQNAPRREYALVCIQDDVKVCVHPANRALLADSSQLINSLVHPLLQLPGVPRVAIEWHPGFVSNPEEITFPLGDGNSIGEPMVFRLAPLLVTKSAPPGDDTLTWSQAVVATWLALQSGHPVRPHFGWFTPEFRESKDHPPPEQAFTDTVDRFSKLDDITRTDWLQQHWVALLDGTLSPSDLP